MGGMESFAALLEESLGRVVFGQDMAGIKHIAVQGAEVLNLAAHPLRLRRVRRAGVRDLAELRLVHAGPDVEPARPCARRARR